MEYDTQSYFFLLSVWTLPRSRQQAHVLVRTIGWVMLAVPITRPWPLLKIHELKIWGQWCKTELKLPPRCYRRVVTNTELSRWTRAEIITCCVLWQKIINLSFLVNSNLWATQQRIITTVEKWNAQIIFCTAAASLETDLGSIPNVLKLTHFVHFMQEC